MMKNEKNKVILKKLGKTILFIVVILIILYVINVIRNNIILSNILSKEESILSVDSVYYEISDEADRISKFYKKGSIEMFDITTNGNQIILWRNTDTNEGIIMYPKQKIANVTKADEMLGLNVPLLVYSNDEIELYRRCMVFSCIIYTEKINNTECYVIMNNFNNKTWIDKDTGVVLKRLSGIIKNENGEEKPGITYYSNWKMNELIDEDILKPDVTDYEVENN